MANKNSAYINKDMLLWARSNTPFTTVAEVEKRLKLKEGKLAAWEKGEELPSVNEAKKLAALYKVPLACFFLSVPPQQTPRNYVDRRTYGGTVYRETSYELWREITRMIQNRKIMLDYADDNFAIPLFSHSTPLSEIASDMREFLGITPPYSTKSIYKSNAFSYFRAILESRGIIVAQITGVSLEEIKGLSIYYDRYPIIAVNNKDYERAKVFSLFHELSHLVRRSSSLCMMEVNERNDEEEKICDRLAAEILMPPSPFIQKAKQIRAKYSDWTVQCLDEIGDKFAVSKLSVLLRLHNLGLLDYQEYQSRYRSLSVNFKSTAATEDKSQGSVIIKHFIRYLNREGYLFPRTIVSAYYRGQLSFGELCQTLGLKSKHISNLEQAVMA